MEKIVTDTITYQVKQQNILTNFQYGFRNGMSCAHALTRLSLSIQANIQEPKRGTTAVLLDLKAAYDSVNRHNLIHMLDVAKIKAQTRNWILDFLSNRFSKTRLTLANNNYILSDELPFTRGVPQGSPLSPILFNLYINDVATEIIRANEMNNNTFFQMYADDIVIWKNNENPQTARRQLQHTLNEIQHFMTARELRLNPKKCQSIGFGKSKEI